MFLPSIAVRSKDSKIGSKRSASSRVKLRSDIKALCDYSSPYLGHKHVGTVARSPASCSQILNCHSEERSDEESVVSLPGRGCRFLVVLAKTSVQDCLTSCARRTAEAAVPTWTLLTTNGQRPPTVFPAFYPALPWPTASR